MFFELMGKIAIIYCLNSAILWSICIYFGFWGCRSGLNLGFCFGSIWLITDLVSITMNDIIFA